MSCHSQPQHITSTFKGHPLHSVFPPLDFKSLRKFRASKGTKHDEFCGSLLINTSTADIQYFCFRECAGCRLLRQPTVCHYTQISGFFAHNYKPSNRHYPSATDWLSSTTLQPPLVPERDEIVSLHQANHSSLCREDHKLLPSINSNQSSRNTISSLFPILHL